MGDIADKINWAWRDFVTDGVMASGKHEVEKSQVREIGPIIEAAIARAGFGALVGVACPTRAALEADLAHGAGVVGLVYADATDANNDLYVKVGATGTGSWTLTTALHDIIHALAQPYVDAVASAADRFQVAVTENRLFVFVDGSDEQLELGGWDASGRFFWTKPPAAIEALTVRYASDVTDGSGDLLQILDNSADEVLLLRIAADGTIIGKVQGVDSAAIATAIANSAAALAAASSALAHATAGATTQRLRDLAIRARGNNRFLNSAMASLPSVVIAAGTTPASGLTRAWLPTSTALQFCGGEKIAFSAGAYESVSAVSYSGSNGNLGAGKAALHWAVRFVTDAPKLTLVVDSDQTSGWFRLWSNDQLAVDFTRIDAAANGTHTITVDFGSSAQRELRLDVTGNSKIGTIWTAPSFTLWHPGEDIRAAFVMDSFGEGLSSRGGAFTAYTPGLALPIVAGAHLGWDNVRQCAIGSTGYLNDAGGVVGKWKWNDHKTDWTAWSPDVVVFWGSVNDTGLDLDAVAAQALITWQDARAALPTVPIIVAGLPSDPAYAASAGTLETKLATKFTTWADSNSVFLPVANDPSGPWLKGNGNTGAGTGNGNSDIYRGPDGTHPNPTGDLFLGRVFADRARAWLLNR